MTSLFKNKLKKIRIVWIFIRIFVKQFKTRDMKTTDLKKECISCNVKRTPIFFKNKKKKNLCSVCETRERKRQKDREAYYKKKNKKADEIRLSIFDEEKELRSKAKLSLDELKEVEKKKLKKGYTWVTKTIQVTKTTTQKQRVLTIIK